jgi:hypothetical protein
MSDSFVLDKNQDTGGPAKVSFRYFEETAGVTAESGRIQINRCFSKPAKPVSEVLRRPGSMTDDRGEKKVPGTISFSKNYDFSAVFFTLSYQSVRDFLANEYTDLPIIGGDSTPLLLLLAK